MKPHVRGLILLGLIAVALPRADAHRMTMGAAQVGDEEHAGDPFVVVLGVAQDGGVPHAGCAGECCAAAWRDPALGRHVSCLAIVDPKSKQRWIIDATPDFPRQLRRLDEVAPAAPQQRAPALDGILLTHGHIGHYTGLMHLGREVMASKDVPVYAMPRMRNFLATNGPWDQLVNRQNISLHPLEADAPVKLNERITVTPFLVPHRDEYTETVGFRIDGPNRSALFIPDIDKWARWERRIEDEIAKVEVAYLDGTFYADGELPDRTMAEIPHPFIIESMQRFGALPPSVRAKLRFIHLNHTNPALRDASPEQRAVQDRGFHIARELERHSL
jgi:pyrroloquinoline quinone biosynthesis protein B